MIKPKEYTVFGERLRKAMMEGLRVVAEANGVDVDELRKGASAYLAQEVVSPDDNEVRVVVKGAGIEPSYITVAL